jgi:thiol-disulfide isomerase/thioredoxin
LPVAFGGALALLALLIGGQLVFPAKAFDVQKVSLNQTIALNGSDEAEASNDEASTDAQTRVAMRVPTEGDTQPAATDVAPTENGDHNESTPAKDAADASIKPNDDPKPTAEGNGPASTAPSPERERNIKLLDGKLTLNVYEHPLLGSPEAKYIVVDMISYNCTHCRKMHATMKRALARYGDQVAVIVMPIPMEKACNRLVTDSAASHAGACTTAGMSLGVARLKPYAFARFHDWLMTVEKEPPPLDAIIARSYGIVDRNRLRELRGGDEITKQIAQYIDLFDMLQKQHKGDKKFGLPVQILGDHIMTGSVENAEDVFKAWEEHLGVKAR